MSMGHQPTYISIDVPAGISQPLPIPPDNPLSEEGVELGRYLFYEKKLSRDNTISCGCCHKQEAAFADPGRQFSTGIDGREGKFQAMAIINRMWQETFFWDGRSHSLEHQAFFPVIDPDEMGEDWDDVAQKLQASPRYPAMFEAAFGDETVSQERIVKAIAQFQRTLVSGNSKFDKVHRGEGSFSQLEAHGLDLFNSEKGDCQHCHSALTGIFGGYGAIQFSNNGLDEPATMKEGRYAVTGNPEDFGKFKIPPLRNITCTTDDLIHFEK